MSFCIPQFPFSLPCYIAVVLFTHSPPPLSYYYAVVADPREQLVETCSHMLTVLLDYSPPLHSGHTHTLLPPEEGKPPAIQIQEETGLTNLFVAYVSRLHQVEVKDDSLYVLV